MTTQLKRKSIEDYKKYMTGPEEDWENEPPTMKEAYYALQWEVRFTSCTNPNRMRSLIY